jgi:hypothetical protein
MALLGFRESLNAPEPPLPDLPGRPEIRPWLLAALASVGSVIFAHSFNGFHLANTEPLNERARYSTSNCREGNAYARHSRLNRLARMSENGQSRGDGENEREPVRQDAMCLTQHDFP